MLASSTESGGDVLAGANEILPFASGVAHCAARIAESDTVEALAQSAQSARRLAVALHRRGAGAALVTGTLSRLNDLITERILALLQARFRLPPTRWCWLGLGSEGRIEQTLATDQDNGLLFSASDDGEARELRDRFLPFAREANRALAECGFPECHGEVMGGNPRWCLSLQEWLARFSSWVRTPEPEALLNASIFFDFRALAGDHALAADLRRDLAHLTRDNDIFLRMMTANALAAQPPLRRLRGFITEPDSGGAIDLKKSGSRIFVDAARIFSLGGDNSEFATEPRLLGAVRDGFLSEGDALASIRAFRLLQELRLDAQIATPEGEPGNRVFPDRLNTFDRHLLSEALRQAGRVQLALKLRFHGEA